MKPLDLRMTKPLIEIAQFLQPHANLILPGLWLGNLQASNIARAESYFNVLNVREEVIPQLGGIQVAEGDSGPFIKEGLEQAVEWVRDNYVDGKHVLVHCYQGIDRSPMVIVQFLMKYYYLTLDDAYAWVAAHRQINDRKDWLPK